MEHIMFHGAKDERNLHHKKIEHFFSSLEVSRFEGLFVLVHFP